MNNYLKSYALLTIAVCWLSAPVLLPAQALLDIQEVTRPAGKIIPVKSQGVGIVDINSQLEIRPNREAIRLLALETAGQSGKGRELTDKLGRINKILRNQQQIIQHIQNALTDQAGSTDSLLLLLRQMTGEIRQDEFLRSDFNDYNREFNERLRQNRDFALTNDRFLYALGRFNDQLDSLGLELSALESSARVKFSLRAFRKDKSGGARLHIENFDQFADGEFFNVNNWVLTFSADQLQELEDYRQLADTLNLGAEQALLSFKNQLFNLLPALDCVGQMPAELRLAAETVPGDVRVLVDQGISNAKVQIEQLKTDLVAMTPGESFDIQGELRSVEVQLDTIFQQTKRSLLNLPQSNAHLANIKNCAEQTLADVRKIKDFVTSFPSTYLQKVYLASDTLADEVLAFDLDAIPEVGTLDLQYTGRREVGDELLIQALFVPADDSVSRRRNFTVIEAHELKMILAGAHSNTKIGVLMAQPYTVDDPDVSKFRFTPSAALLLKFGNRKSHFYNKFLDPGIGIVTSSPDFDRDGVPEFSAGITGSIFRDILSVGWSWNFGADKPFYFLGIHLPFNLPGLPVNTIESNPLPGN